MTLSNISLRFFAGSLPPSPADSGVSDVDPSSSSHNSDDERIHIRQQRNSGELIYVMRYEYFEDYLINSIDYEKFKYLSTTTRITNCLSNDDTGHAQNLNYAVFNVSDYKTLL